MTPHHVSTYAWLAALVFIAGAEVGFALGVRFSPSAHDSLVIERRLREVFCEQVVRNGLMQTCEVFNK